MAEEKIPEEVKKMVVARLLRMPPNYALAVGSEGKLYKRDELIDSVNLENRMGKTIVRMHLSYLRSFRENVEARA
ncbi:MAG: hypothetical protein ACP5E4_04340 [Candidatus Aenigmatarchaeota archaeon]